jgi:hypothetical protein
MKLDFLTMSSNYAEKLKKGRKFQWRVTIFRTTWG